MSETRHYKNCSNSHCITEKKRKLATLWIIYYKNLYQLAYNKNYDTLKLNIDTVMLSIRYGYVYKKRENIMRQSLV